MNSLLSQHLANAIALERIRDVKAWRRPRIDLHPEPREEPPVKSTEAPAVEVSELQKSFGSRPVLDRLSFSVARGSVFALLGPNGAGKTTTVRILATLLPADAGEVRVAGFDVTTHRHEVRRRISLTGQYAAVDALQTGAENLWTIARLAGLGRRASRRRTAELLARFDLEAAAERRVGTYSGGMRRRLDLAASLISKPELLFLDEPTTGLDPASRRELWTVVGELVAAGVTVFLTTQYLEEADRLADRIVVVDDGRIVAEGSAEDLKRQVVEDRLELRLDPGVSLVEFRQRLDGRLLDADPGEHTVTLRADPGAREVRALLDELDPDGTAIAEFALQKATLDDVFLALTGHTTQPLKGHETQQDRALTSHTTRQEETHV